MSHPADMRSLAEGGTKRADIARSAALRALGRHHEARAACLEGLRRSPDCGATLHLLGLIEMDLGHWSVAERVLRRAVAAQPDHAGSAHALGAVLARRGASAEALECLDRAIGLDPGPAAPWLERGRLHVRLGHAAEAERDLGEAARRAPDDPHALDDLGLLLAAQGRGDEAVRCFERAIRALPGYAAAHDHLGAIHLAHGRVAQATRCFENAIHHDADLASAHDHLGTALREQGRFEEAAAHHARARTLTPGDIACAAHHASTLHCLRRDDAAEGILRRLVASAPESWIARTALAELLDWRGDYQQGLALFDGAGAGAEPAACTMLARLLGRVYRVPEAIALLEPLVTARGATASEMRDIELTLAGLYDLEGRTERAFSCWERANGRRAVAFDAARLDAQVDALIGSPPATARPRPTRIERPEPDLLFIVGLPHAGARLVEQVLASQRAVLAAPVTMTLGRFAQGLAAHGQRPYPGCLAQLDAEALARAAARYGATLPPHEPGVRYVVRTAPADFLHLGLVEALFPRARILCCMRNELDAALSSLGGDPLDPDLAHCATLRGIAAWTLAHWRSMAHWRATLRIPIHDVSYEALVSEPERETGSLAAFLGIEWNDGFLRFHETSRAPHLCHARVRRPFYTTSIGRHRRYARELAPLRELLEKS